VPPPGSVDRRRLALFMGRHGIGDYQSFLARSVADPEWFYRSAFEDLGLEWPVGFRAVYQEDSGLPWSRWFVGGRTNLAYLALERWRGSRTGVRTALVWEGDDGATVQLTYDELGWLVEQAAAGLRGMGVRKGDVVALYLPMIPEAVAALLAIARIGAVAATAFSGYGPDALAERLNLSGAKVLITADGFLRRGVPVDLRAQAEKALGQAPNVSRLVVISRLEKRAEENTARSLSWETMLSHGYDRPLEMFDTDTPWLLAFTSGSAGRPKGAVHTHGGLPYRVALELAYCFDMRPHDRLSWVTDMGWIMGPLSIAGVLSLGASLVLFEGVPDFPEPDRLWRLVERHKVTHLGLSPTLVRRLAGYGEEWVDRHQLRSLRVLGSTGERWTPQSWRWLHRHVGRGSVPIINWSGGTEIGCGILVGSPLVATRECRFSGHAPGMAAAVFDAEGRPLIGEVGELVLTRTWPSMTRGLWNEPQRYLESYWARWPDVWVHGDWAVHHEDGSWELLGRSDDVLKIAGKRLGPAEVESVATELEDVTEAAAVSVPDSMTGEALVVLIQVSVTTARDDHEAVARAVSDRVAEALGKPLRPAAVVVLDELPQSRSGKVHRRALRAWLAGTDPGDLSTLANPESASPVLAAAERLSGHRAGKS
jgi:acetyl-CoA synthetase